MKKAKLMVVDFVNMMTRTSRTKSSSKMIFAEYLPMEAKLFVQRNFPNLAIAFAEKKVSLNGVKYEVTLNDGTEIGFDKDGSWNMVDCKMTSVPAALMPESVDAFMKAYYANMMIVKIEKSDKGYELMLFNYVKLMFNMEEKAA